MCVYFCSSIINLNAIIYCIGQVNTAFVCLHFMCIGITVVYIKKKICPTMYLYIKTSNMHMSYIVNTHGYVPCTHLCGTFVRETGKYGSARAILSATTRSFHAPFTFQFSSFPLYIFENSSIVYNPSRVYCKRYLSGVLYTIRYSYMLV